MLQTLDASGIRSHLFEGTGTVVADFYADWCPYCPEMARTLEEVAPGYPAVTFLKVNVDDHPDITEQARVSKLPTAVVYRAGQEVARLVGVRPAAEVRKALNQSA
jgi:thioredoxin 1